MCSWTKRGGNKAWIGATDTKNDTLKWDSAAFAPAPPSLVSCYAGNAGKRTGVKIEKTTPQHISDIPSKAGASGALPRSIPIVMPGENAA